MNLADTVIVYAPMTTKAAEADVKPLYEAHMQYGYSRTRRHPSMLAFIFGQKNRTDIIDLAHTKTALDTAAHVVADTIAAGKQVLFVGGKNEARTLLKRTAEKVDQPYVAGRWIGGTLSNFAQISKRIKRHDTLVHEKESGIWQERYKKKERLMLTRELEKLQLMFGGIVSMKELPGLVVIVDPRHEIKAVREAERMHIPVVALANTDCDVQTIAYPVPGNDSAQKSIRFFLDAVIAQTGAAKQHKKA